jgi:hypothetical protein
MRSQPDDVLACKINAHRSSWNGSICHSSERWPCGAEPTFRSQFCAQGEERCYHLHTFEIAAPRLKVSHHPNHQLLERESDRLVDQLLVLYGQRFDDVKGQVTAGGGMVMYGLYRIKRVRQEAVSQHGRKVWVIEPYDNGWARFPQGASAVAMTEFFGFGDEGYFKRTSAREVLKALQKLRPNPSLYFNEADVRRLTHVKSQFLLWQKEAQSIQLLPPEVSEEVLPAPIEVSEPIEPTSQAIREVMVEASIEASNETPAVVIEAPIEATPEATLEASPASEPVSEREPLLQLLPEPSQAEIVREQYGDNTLRSLWVAFAAKKLVILSGTPGTGKSRLATHLLDDDSRERTLILPVASTWRGREDLLGYVNPISGDFEATPFTLFLLKAHDAWQAGDTRPRLVIFEEFNLSQPEHWFSDILVRSEYEDAHDRLIHLGGVQIRGGLPPVLPLSPALYFVGTVNHDHTVRSLSPRVLDRAALIDIDCDLPEALRRIAVPLEAGQTEAVSHLVTLLEGKGITFSLRTAQSFKKALLGSASVGIEQPEALDLVLVQELLSKVQLLAGNPADARLLEQLQQWGSQQPFPHCQARIQRWQRVLEQGLDWMQA